MLKITLRRRPTLRYGLLEILDHDHLDPLETALAESAATRPAGSTARARQGFGCAVAATIWSSTD